MRFRKIESPTSFCSTFDCSVVAGEECSVFPDEPDSEESPFFGFRALNLGVLQVLKTFHLLQSLLLCDLSSSQETTALSTRTSHCVFMSRLVQVGFSGSCNFQSLLQLGSRYTSLQDSVVLLSVHVEGLFRGLLHLGLRRHLWRWNLMWNRPLGGLRKH